MNGKLTSEDRENQKSLMADFLIADLCLEVL